MFIGLILLILVAYLLINGDPRVSLPQKSSAEEKLKERYTNGEIDEEAYVRMKSVIHGK